MGNIKFTVFVWNEDESCWRFHAEIQAVSFDAAQEYFRKGGQEGTYMMLSSELLKPFKLVNDTSLIPIDFGEWVR